MQHSEVCTSQWNGRHGSTAQARNLVSRSGTRTPWLSAALTTYRLSGAPSRSTRTRHRPSRHRERRRATIRGSRSDGQWLNRAWSSATALRWNPASAPLERAPVRPCDTGSRDPRAESPQPNAPWSRVMGLMLDTPAETATVPRLRSCTASNTSGGRSPHVAGRTRARTRACPSLGCCSRWLALPLSFGGGLNSRKPRAVRPGASASVLD